MRHCRHNTDILDIYMKKFNNQKVFLENGSCVDLDKFVGLHLNGVMLLLSTCSANMDRSAPSSAFDGLILYCAFTLQKHWTFS